MSDVFPSLCRLPMIKQNEFLQEAFFSPVQLDPGQHTTTTMDIVCRRRIRFNQQGRIILLTIFPPGYGTILLRNLCGMRTPSRERMSRMAFVLSMSRCDPCECDLRSDSLGTDGQADQQDPVAVGDVRLFGIDSLWQIKFPVVGSHAPFINQQFLDLFEQTAHVSVQNQTTSSVTSTTISMGSMPDMGAAIMMRSAVQYIFTGMDWCFICSRIGVSFLSAWPFSLKAPEMLTSPRDRPIRSLSHSTAMANN